MQFSQSQISNLKSQMLIDPNASPIHPSSSSHASSSTDLDRSLGAYDYILPPERIAQNPVVPRDSSRLLVVESPTLHRHCIFRDLPCLLKPGDLLVLNNTRVMPARLKGRKSTGAPAEILLLQERQPNTWLALVKPGKRLKPGAKIYFEPQGEWGLLERPDAQRGGEGEAPEAPDGESLNIVPASERPRVRASQKPPFQLSATVLAVDEATGGRILQFDVPEGATLGQLLEKYGVVPLPPYITASSASPEQYQTIYAQQSGAVAAPTAGLHFTDELLEVLQEKGIERAFVTLHVGVGTFRPVEVEDVTSHKMHEEWVEVREETVEKIRKTQHRGGRIIAVGTTVVRSLEAAASGGQIQPFCGQTDLFIYPGYQWRVVQGLITNFHLPRSSLLMLVSAFIGRGRLLDLYREAIAQQYRFYSFGDAMLILPEARNQT